MDYIFLESTESTNSCLLTGDYRDGTVIATTNQTAGRGRSGRVWQSAAGQCLALSLQLPKCDPRLLLGTQIAAGFAVVEALAPWADVRLKWPNDLVVKGRKLGGMLIETRFSGSTLLKAVYGVGINLNDVPPAFENQAVSLREAGANQTVKADEVINACIKALSGVIREYMSGELNISAEWPLYSANFGKKIAFHLNGEVTELTELGITPQGRLIAKDSAGVEQILTEGEIGYDFP